MLHITASYHRMQFQGKTMIQIEANGKKPHFGSSVTRYHGQLRNDRRTDGQTDG